MLFEKAVKDILSVLRKSLTSETYSKMMENAFYFTLKALFVLKIFKFLSKIYDATAWETRNYSTYIAQYLKKQRQLDNKIWAVNRM